MSKLFKKARTRCPIVFYEEIIAVLEMKNLKLTEIDKSFQIFEVFVYFCYSFDRLGGFEC